MSTDNPKRIERPKKIADGTGTLRTYAELLAMAQAQLIGDGRVADAVVVGEEHQPALDARDERIDDLSKLLLALDHVYIPFASHRIVIRKLTALRHELSVLHWPDKEQELRSHVDRIVSRLRHTRRQPGIATYIRRKLKRANQMPSPTRRRTV